MSSSPSPADDIERAKIQYSGRRVHVSHGAYLLVQVLDFCSGLSPIWVRLSERQEEELAEALASLAQL